MKQPFLLQFNQAGSSQAGFLSAIPAGPEFPFQVHRLYWLYQVPDSQERGNQAHLNNQQVLVAVQGRIKVQLENTLQQTFEFMLTQPNEGLYIPALYWRKVQFFDSAVVLALSSNAYHADDYIRSYDAFRAIKDERSE